MKIVIEIPEEQIKKSLEESKYVLEDEGEKGSVNITMLYTNARLEFVDVERKTDFYSCEYKILPENHGRLIDADALPISHGVFVPRVGGEVILCAPMDAVFVDEIKDAPTIIEGSESE